MKERAKSRTAVGPPIRLPDARFLDTIYEHIPNMIFVKDARDLRFVSLNRTAEEVLGLSRRELIGKRDHDFFPKEEADFFTAHDRQVLEGGEPVDIPEEPIHTRGKGLRYLHTKKVPIIDESGNRLYLLGISEDVTDLKRIRDELHESERQNRALLAAIPDMLFVIDRQGRFLSYVPAKDLEPLAPPSEFIGKTIDDVLPEVAASTHETVARALDSGETQTFEYQVVRDGQPRHFESRIVASGDDQALAIVRDITGRVKAEEKVRRQQAELAHVSRLGALGQTAAGVAHEINQPLAAIINHAEACRLAIRSGHASTQEILDDLDSISAQADRADAIIRRLRNFVRKREPRRRAVDIRRVIEDVTTLLVSETRQHQIRLSAQSDEALPPVLGDPIEIQQVLVNLLMNGIEAVQENGPADRELRVRASAPETGGDVVEVAVSDNGPPLGLPDLEQLFEPFYTTKADGLGMGLSICRSILDDLGGHLIAVRNPERGLTFRFQLPVLKGQYIG